MVKRRSRSALFAGITAAALLMSGLVHSGEIARWVDADGRVHFGNAQFAPQDRAEAVKVSPTNRMDVPVYNPQRPAVRAKGAGFVRVPHSTDKNLKKGFRGYHNRSKSHD